MISPDSLGVEVFDRWVTIDLSARSLEILGYHWDLFQDVLEVLDLRSARRSTQKMTTVDGERVKVDEMDDEDADAAAHEVGEQIRDRLLAVIDAEDLVKTGEFRDDVQSAAVRVEAL